MVGSGKGPLRIAIEDWLATFDLGAILGGWVKRILELLEDENLRIYRSLVIALGLDGQLPPEYQPDNLDKLVKQAPAGFWVSLTSVVGLLLGGFLGVSAPLSRRAQYAIDQFQRTYRPGAAEIWQLARRHPPLMDAVVNNMKSIGVEDILIDAYRAATEFIIPPQDLERLRLRQLIDDDLYVHEMLAQGVTYERIEQIRALNRLIPGPGDLISMAVREAWDDDVSARFNYDAGLPGEFVTWMERQGFTTDWSKRYWRQHWQLPGISQAYEMLHRLRPGKTDTPFELADMERLLKAADIPEFFRSRLIATSYNPYTRVDVRRLYGTGVITEQEVYDNYLDLGYDEQHARNLTTFTTAGARAEERGITPSTITSLYHDALLARDAAKTMLTDLGYSQDNAEYLLLLVDVALDQADANERLADIRDRYVNGEMDESQLQAALGPLNLASDRQTRLLASWQIKRQAKIRRPSAAQLETWYKLGYVSAADYLAGVTASGYTASDAELFVRQTDAEIQAEAIREADRAQTAADKLSASTTATEARKQLADLDVSIAYDRLQIANARVAGHGAISDEQKTQLTGLIDQLTVEIAELVLQKSQVRLGAI